jgi:hypothetical protein
MATITKKLGFENLLSNPSLNKDTDINGVADGWTKNTSFPNATAEFLFDAVEGIQMVNVLSSTGVETGVNEYQDVTVTAGTSYVLSVYAKSDAANVSVKPRAAVQWIHSVTGEAVGTGNGTNKTFTVINKPIVPDSQVVKVAGVTKTEGTDYTFDDTTGTITFTTAPANGAAVTADYKYFGTTYTVTTGTDTVWTRYISAALTAPTGAVSARIRLGADVTASGASGAVWLKNAQFQQGTTATDYEENDFFTRLDTAEGYTYGWSITSSRKETGVYGYQSASRPAGSTDSPGAKIRFTTPENAGTVTVTMWVDASTLHSSENFKVWEGWRKVLDIPGGTPAGTYSFTIARGLVGLVLQHVRSASSTGAGVTIDNIQVQWDEVTATTIQLPTADVVKYLDFESAEYDSFFTVTDKYPGFTYGFARKIEQRSSGFYSYGVEDTDTSPVDEAGDPKTIPDGSTAKASIKFSVPISALNPTLKFKAMHDAENNYDTGKFVLNGETIWTGTVSNGWEDVEVTLSPGVSYELTLEFTKDGNTTDKTDSVYIDDVIVYYDIPDKEFMLISTAPKVEIKTQTKTFTVMESFEDPYIDTFFSYKSPADFKSGGGPSQYPEAGWVRADLVKDLYGLYPGGTSTASSSKMLRAYREATKNDEDAAVRFRFSVPSTAKNPKIEWWNLVELERSVFKDSSGYLRLYEEYRIWVNGGIYREFEYCSTSLTASKYVTGYRKFVCPWGRWWKETITLTPGETYTIVFELQRDSGDSSPIHGRNILAIDDLKVTWDETPGDVQLIPPQPLIFLDGRDGYKHLYHRQGAEAPPISFAEYQAFNVDGSIYQQTNIDPRMVQFPIVIEGTDKKDLLNKRRTLVSTIVNKDISLQVVQPEGERRTLNCRYAGGIEGVETPQTQNGTRKKHELVIFRGFDPYWYGDMITYNAGDPGVGVNWLTVTNPGDAKAWPIFKIYGPMGSPNVQLTELNSAGSDLASFKLNYTIPAGRYVVVDTRPQYRRVILDDGTSLYNYLDETYDDLFGIPPGEWGIDVDPVSNSTDSNTRLYCYFQPPYHHF